MTENKTRETQLQSTEYIRSKAAIHPIKVASPAISSVQYNEDMEINLLENNGRLEVIPEPDVEPEQDTEPKPDVEPEQVIEQKNGSAPETNVEPETAAEPDSAAGADQEMKFDPAVTKAVNVNDFLTFEGAVFKNMMIFGEEGQPLFLLDDVCAALDCDDTDEITAGLDADEIVTIVQDSCASGKQVKNTNSKTNMAVNIPGLYKIIFQSKNPNAKLLERWADRNMMRVIGKTYKKSPVCYDISAAKLAAVVSYVRELRMLMNNLSCCPSAIARMTEYVCVSYGLAFPPGFADCEKCTASPLMRGEKWLAESIG